MGTKTNSTKNQGKKNQDHNIERASGFISQYYQFFPDSV